MAVPAGSGGVRAPGGSRIEPGTLGAAVPEAFWLSGRLLKAPFMPVGTPLPDRGADRRMVRRERFTARVVVLRASTVGVRHWCFCGTASARILACRAAAWWRCWTR